MNSLKNRHNLLNRHNINGTCSSTYDAKYGVPQGSVLGPVPYLLYTASVADIIKRYDLDYHIYADDTQLYVSFEVDGDVGLAKTGPSLER